MRNWSTMLTASNGNIFRDTGLLCGEFTGEFPSQRSAMRSFDIFFDLCLNKRLKKTSRRRWFETPSRLLWHHCTDSYQIWCLSWGCRHVDHKQLNKLQNGNWNQMLHPIRIRHELFTAMEPSVAYLTATLGMASNDNESSLVQIMFRRHSNDLIHAVTSNEWTCAGFILETWKIYLHIQRMWWRI